MTPARLALGRAAGGARQPASGVAVLDSLDVPEVTGEAIELRPGGAHDGLRSFVGTVGQNDALDDGPELVGVVGLLHQGELGGRDARHNPGRRRRTDSTRQAIQSVPSASAPFSSTALINATSSISAVWRDVVFDEEQRSLSVRRRSSVTLRHRPPPLDAPAGAPPAGRGSPSSGRVTPARRIPPSGRGGPCLGSIRTLVPCPASCGLRWTRQR